MRPKTLLLVVVALAVCFTVSAPKTFASANLVNNGSFETGDFSGWTTGGNFEFSQVVTGSFGAFTGAQDGAFYATFGPLDEAGTISQTLSTVAGTQYNFSFWLNAVGDDPSSFSVTWDGNTLMSLSDPSTGGVWTQFSFNETGTGSDTITFSFIDNPAYIALDNVSVTAGGGTGTVPEPSSFLLMGSGVLGIGAAIRRKLRR